MKKVALYIRVSTSKQASGADSQKHALIKYAKSKDFEYEIFEDQNVSGMKSSRPQLDQMMNEVRAGNIDSVVVYSFSRFARSTSHLLSALKEFNSLGVGFISISENIDTSSPMGKAVFIIISAVAELERDLIAERVRSGLENAKSKGKRIGRPKSRNSKLIQELYLKGYNYREISKLAKCSLSTVSRELNVRK